MGELTVWDKGREISGQWPSQVEQSQLRENDLNMLLIKVELDGKKQRLEHLPLASPGTGRAVPHTSPPVWGFARY